MKPIDLILILVLAVVIFLAVRSIYRRKGTCSCGCENCTQSCTRSLVKHAADSADQKQS